MQQRYQFILKGTGPLLKEWDIVLSIYDNEKLIVKLKEQQNRLDNSSLDNEIESLPKPKDSEELENQLVEYRAQLQSQPTQDFINKPPLDEERNQMNYKTMLALLALSPTVLMAQSSEADLSTKPESTSSWYPKQLCKSN